MSPTDEHRHVELADTYEHTDAEPRPVVAFVIGLVALCIVSFAICIPLMRLLESTTDSATAVVSPHAERQLPGVARLQPNPAEELRAYEADQKAQVTGYGWVNRNTNTVSVPIDVALDLVAKQGLPVRQEAAAPSTATATAASDQPN